MIMPQEHQVICGRGFRSSNWAGNKRFQSIIDDHVHQYSASRSRTEKSAVVTAICRTVRELGDFVRLDTSSTWIKAPERLVREKCGAALRDALHAQYSSATKSKKVRRKQDLSFETDIVQSNYQICAILKRMEGTALLSDTEAESLFHAANVAILDELKLRRNMNMSLISVTSSAPPSPISLTNKISDDLATTMSLSDLLFYSGEPLDLEVLSLDSMLL